MLLLRNGPGHARVASQVSQGEGAKKRSGGQQQQATYACDLSAEHVSEIAGPFQLMFLYYIEKKTTAHICKLEQGGIT